MVKKIFSSNLLVLIVIASLAASSFGIAFIAKTFLADVPTIFITETPDQSIDGIVISSSPLTESLKDIENMSIQGWTALGFTSPMNKEEVRNTMVANRSAISSLMCSKDIGLSAQSLKYQDYTKGGDINTFAVASYPTGAAPYALKKLVDTCLDAATVITQSENEYTISTPAGNLYLKVSGDSILAATGQNLLQESADSWFDEVKRIFSTRGCVNTNPAVGDEKRNKFYIGDGAYVQKVTKVNVEVEPLPTGITDPANSEATLPLVTPDDNPTQITEVEVPETPDSHAYWPSMPTLVALPQAPEILAVPVDNKDVNIPVVDETGPGCGWAFSGYAPTVQPSESDLQLAGDNIKEQVKEALIAGQQQYLASVTNYYKTIDGYNTAVAEYGVYGQQLKDVYSQWTSLQIQWLQYDTDKARYDKAWADYAQWFVDRDAAQAKYDTAMKQYNDDVVYCEALVEPSPSPSPSPSPAPTTPPAAPSTAAATTTAASPATTTEPPVETVVCPPVEPDRPNIIDARPPSEPALTKPTPPRNPDA